MTRFFSAAHRASVAVACAAFLAPSAIAATITWTGATNSNWSTATNWDLGRAPIDDDDVVLVQAGSAPTNQDLAGVTLHSVTRQPAVSLLTISGNDIALRSGGLIHDLSGGGIAFNTNIVLNGPATFDVGDTNFNGAISGTGPVSLIMCGFTRFKAANSYSGGTAIAGSGACAPVGPALIAQVAGSIPSGSAVTVTSGMLDFEVSHSVGSLAGAAAGTVRLANGSQLTVGGDNTSTTFAGSITQVAGPGSLVKNGSGQLTLSGANTYTGTTTVLAGSLRLAGSLASPVTVNTASGLRGQGTINAPVTINSGAQLTPAGNAVLAMGNLAMSAGSDLGLTVTSATPLFLAVTGSVNINGVILTLTSGSVAPGTVITVIDNDGADPVVGTFSGTPEGSVRISGGTTYVVSYVGGDGNDVTLTSVAAPGAPTIGTAAAGNGQATVNFTPGAANGSPITGFTATCNPGNISAPGGAAATSIVVPGLANGTPYTCSVTATNAFGTSVASGTVAVTPANTAFSGPSATGTGTISASFTGGGAACTFTSAQFIPLTGNPASPPGPAPASFPHGLFDFTLGGCTPGSTITMTVVYPAALVAGTQYWKYGPTPGNPAGAWYVMPATITGSTVVFSITDGGLGDDDLAANGTIVDQGGPGNPGPPGSPTAIPTLHEWALMVLALALMASGLGYARRQRPM